MRELDSRGEIRFRIAELAEARDNRIDLGTLARQRPVAVDVTRRIFGREQGVEFRETRAQLVELGAKRLFHAGPRSEDYESPSGTRAIDGARRGSFDYGDTRSSATATRSCRYGSDPGSD